MGGAPGDSTWEGQCVRGNIWRERVSHVGIREKWGHIGAHSLADTTQYCSKGHLWVPHRA